jgi:hypothetical protein
MHATRHRRDRGPDSALLDQAVLELPARLSLALLEPGLGIVNITGITDGQMTGGGLVPIDDPPDGGSPSTGTTLPSTALPLSLPAL